MLDEHHEPVGITSKPIEDVDDCVAFLRAVRTARTSTGTRMNQATNEHGESSRSHCAMILTLQKVNQTTGVYTRTLLKIVDLAGAERPGKN
jgi:hypothetical protein